MSDRLTACLIAFSCARLHVNARFQPMRQTLRQAQNVTPLGGDATSRLRTSTDG